MLNDAVELEYLEINPFRRAKPLELPEQAFKFWTVPERDRFLTWVKDRDLNVWEAVTLAVNTGLRLGEIEGLFRDCVDFDAQVITVKRQYNYRVKRLLETTKGKRIRQVPINEAVMEVLRSRQLLAPNQPIFSFRVRDMGERIKLLARRAGVTPIRFHDLRHSFASHMAMAGVSLYDLMTILGHQDIKTTQRYMHLDPNHLKGLTDALVRKPVRNNQNEQSKVIELKGN